MSKRLRVAVLSYAVLVLAFGSAELFASEPAAPLSTDPQADRENADWRKALVSEEIVNFASTPASELKLRVVPMPLEALERKAGAVLDGLQTVAAELAEALITQMRMAGAESVDERTNAELTKRIDALTEFRSDLLTRCSIVLAAAEEKGGNVAGARAYVAAIQKLEPEPLVTTEESLTAEQQQSKELAERVATAIARVREMPPVHERPEPWTVSVNELELELQPLRKEEIKERIELWLAILQRQLRQRIRMDIAVAKCEDDDERQALADKSAEQHQIVQAVVERIEAALVLLQKRGGQISEYETYIAHATGQKLNLTDPAVFWAQVKSWIRSPDGGLKIALNLLKFLAILVVFWIASRAIGSIVRAAAQRAAKTSNLLQDFLTGMSRRIIMIVGIVVAISALGININPLIAAIGAAGLVIGLALQGTLSNFASGILILISRPFDVGDVISAGGVSGKVDAMNLVSTRILTFDNQVMLVPNNQIWNGVITNVTALKTRRVDLVFGISYGDVMARAQDIIEELLKDHPKVLEEPAPTVKVHELGDNSVNFIVRPWVSTPDYWEVYWDLTRQVKQAFDEQGINIPFPQRDLHLAGPIDVVVKSDGITPPMSQPSTT